MLRQLCFTYGVGDSEEIFNNEYFQTEENSQQIIKGIFIRPTTKQFVCLGLLREQDVRRVFKFRKRPKSEYLTYQLVCLVMGNIHGLHLLWMMLCEVLQYTYLNGHV